MPDVIGWLVANWIEALGFATGIASVWLFARHQCEIEERLGLCP